MISTDDTNMTSRFCSVLPSCTLHEAPAIECCVPELANPLKQLMMPLHPLGLRGSVCPLLEGGGRGAGCLGPAAP
ncbi:hypothetical protein I7I53_11914 [Histoplasma capsulatum var. duboisii H88]|uniref:Uncharacterized protein n=1 Tax=Ajellomyces capsulatus (strain H88) TaxID=544711 RepID=A0A8A1M0F1_AJEC8|nr:hypothetical protein I7I53_11914 [Histoplasma capsulatum var. duboisii H88]